MRAQAPIWSWIFLGLFVLFAVILMRLFLFAFLDVGINLAILYFIFLHLRAEFVKRKRAEVYLIGMLGGLIVLLLLGNVIPLWKLTTLAILSLLFGKLYLALSRP